MTEYLNKNDICIVCFGCPKDTKLIKHHLSYFPERVAYVHYDCHKKIHESPLDVFIQYKQGDSRKFYSTKKNTSGSTIETRLLV